MSLLASFSILLSTSSRKIKDSSGKAAKHCLSAAVVMILTTEYLVARTVALGERHRPKTLNSPKRTASAMLVTSMLMCLIPSWSWIHDAQSIGFSKRAHGSSVYRKRVGGMYYILLLCSWNTLDITRLWSKIIYNHKIYLYASTLTANKHQQKCPSCCNCIISIHIVAKFSFLTPSFCKMYNKSFTMPFKCSKDFKSERVESKNFQHIWTHNWHIWIIMIA